MAKEILLCPLNIMLESSVPLDFKKIGVPPDSHKIFLIYEETCSGGSEFGPIVNIGAPERSGNIL